MATFRERLTSSVRVEAGTSHWRRLARTAMVVSRGPLPLCLFPRRLLNPQEVRCSPPMDEKWCGLIETLQAQREERIVGFMLVLNTFLPLESSLKGAERDEFDRIDRAVRALSHDYHAALQDLHLSSAAQEREYLLRLIALLEHYTEALGELT